METANIPQLKDKLMSLLKKEAFRKGKFILSSGKESSFYLDGRVITMTPEGAYLIAVLVLDMIRSDKVDAFGGPTLGADPIVADGRCIREAVHDLVCHFVRIFDDIKYSCHGFFSFSAQYDGLIIAYAGP